MISTSIKPPEKPSDLIGPARKAAEVLCRIAEQHKDCVGDNVIKVLLYGPPGTGKSAVASMVAKILLGGCMEHLEHTNGKQIDIATMRQWQLSIHQGGSLFSKWRVRMIDEVDLASLDAQNLMLTVLDKMAPGNAIICTSNMSLSKLQERFHTRFEKLKILGPGDNEVRKWLIDRYDCSEERAEAIAFNCGGNVRLALEDLKTASLGLADLMYS